MSDWQKIETAPKDPDVAILLWGRYWSDDQGWFQRPLMGYWNDRSQRWEATGEPYHSYPFGVRPTHWQPLPEPPSPTEE